MDDSLSMTSKNVGCTIGGAISRRRRRRRRRLLATDVLLDVLVFLHIEMIIKGAGLNTASWELSRLIAQYHPALKRLFSKGERAISGKLEIGQRIFYRGCWKAWVCGTESGDGELRCYLPLPTLPASKDILGVNNIRLNTEDVFSRDNLEKLFVFFTNNSHFFNNHTLRIQFDSTLRVVIRGFLALDVLEVRAIELEISSPVRHQQMHKLFCDPFAPSVRTSNLSIRIAQYHPETIDSMLSSLLEWLHANRPKEEGIPQQGGPPPETAINRRPHRTFDVDVCQCINPELKHTNRNLSPVCNAEKFVGDIVERFSSAQTASKAISFSVSARFGVVNSEEIKAHVLAEINDHMECDSVSPFQVLAEFDAALVAAGVPSTVPSFFMDNLQTGERLRIDVWNECCQRFTSKIVHVRRFLLDGQEEESQEYARGSGTPSPPYIFVGRRCNYWRRCRWAYWGLDDSESLDDAEDWRLSYFF